MFYALKFAISVFFGLMVSSFALALQAAPAPSLVLMPGSLAFLLMWCLMAYLDRPKSDGQGSIETSKG